MGFPSCGIFIIMIQLDTNLTLIAPTLKARKIRLFGRIAERSAVGSSKPAGLALARVTIIAGT
ncbi:MAG: hypothetical protein EXQ89_06400 [Rhodospirillaceae bacterium]|nr:hypothetical protein [Rhodospirillaceae bacterium]